MPYAIVEFAGKQFLIEPSQDIVVDGIWGKTGESINFERVLLLSGDKLELGSPYLKLSLAAVVKEHSQAKKISVRTYKSKSRYRRHKGYRGDLTTLTVQSFTSAKKAEPKVETTDKPAINAAKKTVTKKANAK